MDYHLTPCEALSAEITVPGDKSISHRALMLAAIAHGSTHISGLLTGSDCLATLTALRSLGVTISDPNDGHVDVEGVGLYGLQAPNTNLDLGNSGTSIRLLAGILAAQAFSSVLTGDASLQHRPMFRIVTPLRQMGAKISLTNDQYAPITIQNNQQLTAIDYHSPIASAQVKSCLLLAGLYAQGETTIVEPAATRDHTEIMLAEFGVHTKKRNRQISIKGGKELVATSITIPGDMSSAAFFIVAATLIPNSNLIIKNVGINPTRIGCIHLLMQMGANIKLFNQRQINGEAIADIKIQHALLQGIEIGQDQISAAIDEFPILFIAAACAEGQTILHGASELRVKESDRIHAMAAGLKILGIHCEEFADGMVITGGTLQGGCVDSHGDHRVAMAFSIAACVAKDAVTVENCQNIETSFPGFVELARSIGMIISVDE